jgi:dTMP kinase
MARAATAAEEIAALRGTRPATLKDLLTHPSFSRLWRAMLVSSLGDWVGFVAVAALVARLGGERVGERAASLAVAGVMLARLLPSVLFGPFAGVFADRFDRRKLMVGADLARGAMYVSLPFMPGLLSIFLLSFFIECMSLLWTPAKDASVPNLVPRRQLANANSVGLITTYGTLPLGAAIFTALAGVSTAIGHRVAYFGHHPEFLALWLDAATFLFSARMVWGLDLRHGRRPSQPGGQTKLDFREAVQEARDGYRFLADHPLIKTMTVAIVIAFSGVGAVIALGPAFSLYSLRAGSTGFGVLITAFGVGMAAGLGLMNLLSRFASKDRLMYLSMIGASAFLMVLAAMPNITLAALFTVPMGVFTGIAWVTGYTMLQENVADEYRGRTFATLTIAARMVLFVALVAFPALAAGIGPNHTVTVAGHVLDFSGVRITLWLGAVVVIMGGLFSRSGLKRSRLARPRPLALVPRLLKSERTGVLIVFEGVEGAGKGTQIELAADYVRAKGVDVVVTREPGGTGFGDRLRDAILDPSTGTVDPRAEALVFAAARAHLVSTVIRPALDEGKVVLCDRFVDSSVAYQGFGRGLGEQDVLTLNAWATQGLFPDLVILLHVEPEEGLARSDGAPDRFESEDIAFHAKVADAYLRIAEEHPDRFHVADGRGTPQEVHERVRAGLDRVLGRILEGRAGPT